MIRISIFLIGVCVGILLFAFPTVQEIERAEPYTIDERMCAKYIINDIRERGAKDVSWIYKYLLADCRYLIETYPDAKPWRDHEIRNR